MKDTCNITAITVTCDTPALLSRMYSAFRDAYRDMPLIIVDNSLVPANRCKSTSDYVTVHHFDNIGHGRGLDFAIRQAKTDYVLIMDTDTVILRDPLPEMMQLMDADTYGVGCVTEIGRDGYDFRTFKTHKVPIKYLHPFFALISTEQYKRFKPFVHHGAPWYKTAVQLHDIGETYRIKHFPGLQAFDHDYTGRLTGATTEYVRHDFGGTRMANKAMGRDEIKLGWEL